MSEYPEEIRLRKKKSTYSDKRHVQNQEATARYRARLNWDKLHPQEPGKN